MKRLQITGLVLAIAATSGCDLILENPNNPDVGSVTGSPDATEIAQTTSGLLLASRTGKITLTGQLASWGIFGREAFIFDPADPRFILEYIGPNPDENGEFPDRDLNASTLDPNSFGGGFWAVPYRTLQQGELLLDLLGDGGAAADIFSEQENAAIRGFVRWIQAISLEQVVTSHICPPAIADEPLCVEATQRGFNEAFFIGVVLNWDAVDFNDASTFTAEALQANAPITADWDSAMARVDSLLAEAATELAAAGDVAFPFGLSSGYADFGTPAGMLQVVNGFRARVALYRDQFDEALGFLENSFLDEDTFAFAGGAPIADDPGVFHSYSTGAGDVQNGLSPITIGTSPTIYAHPSITTGAETQVGGDPDLRIQNRLAAPAAPPSIPTQGLPAPEFVWAVYPTLSSPIPIIRNEELVLIKIEALGRQSTPDLAAAAALANSFRSAAGGLADDITLADEDAVIAEVFAQRSLSLGFQGGHRWIDAKRLDLLDELPRDRPADAINLVFAVSPNETNARDLLDDGEEE